ncbi:MAG: YncE family protein [Hyphomicrobiaceae bacterium]|nr:YncE family protein [Hyphomicrobiaceae bacterium]MCC0008201.1 YncE family protein [Hyphomicrobiaceae bacterium]
MQPLAVRAGTLRRSFVAALASIVCVAVVPAKGASAGSGGREHTGAVPTAFAYVTNQGSETVSIVAIGEGGEKMQVTGEIKVPGKPAGIALSPDRRTVYVTAPEAKELVVIDRATADVRARVRAGEGPLGIAVNPVTGDVLVADWYEHKLLVLDATTLAVKGAVKTGQSPSGIAVTPDGGRILTTDRDSNQVSIIDAKSLAVVATVPVGERPFGIAIDADGQRAYTANVKSNDVSVIDIATARTVATYKVGRRPYAVALARGRAFVTDQYSATVTVIDLTSGEKLTSIPVGEHPEGIWSTASGSHVFIACWMENTLERVDTGTLKVTGKVEVGDGPRAFGDFLVEEAPSRAPR